MSATQRSHLSLSQFAEQYEVIAKEKDDLLHRLRAALEEKAALAELHTRMRAQFDAERNQLNSEISSLRERSTPTKLLASAATSDHAFKSVISAKERLMREEYEHRFQELKVALKRERSKYSQHLETLKKQRATCICQ